MKRIAAGILGGISAALMLAAPGHAAEQHQGVQSETRAEAQERAGHLFDKLDLNHDGKLDESDRVARDAENSISWTLTTTAFYRAMNLPRLTSRRGMAIIPA